MSTAFNTQLIYIALFGRPGEPEGVKYWDKALEQNPGLLPFVFNAFAASAEYTQQFSRASDTVKVEKVFANLFNHAPDADVTRFWREEMARGETLSGIAVRMAESARGADLEAVTAKLSAATLYTGLVDKLGALLITAGPAVTKLGSYLVGYVHDTDTLAHLGSPYWLQEISNHLLRKPGAAFALPDAMDAQVQQLYVAYFSRAADPAGLAYWTRLIDGDPHNAQLDAIAAAFGASAEYRSAYAQATSALKVDAIYQHLFSRPAESAGMAYWADLLDKGAITIDKAVTAISEGAQGMDKTLFGYKTEVAREITQALDTKAEQAAYATPFAANKVVAYLAGVAGEQSYLASIDPRAIDALIFSFSGNTGPVPPSIAPPPAELVGIAASPLEGVLLY